MSEVNYTDEMVARMKEVYDGAASPQARDLQVKQLADELGKSPASIRAKLTRERVYVPKGPKAKGPKAIRKAEIVNLIADKVGVNAEIVESLEKATKNALLIVARGLEAE